MSQLNSDGNAATRGLPRWLARATAAVIVVGGASYWWFNRETAPSLDDLLTAEVVRGDIENTVTALGNLQPRDYVDVGAQVSGQLKKIHVAIGDTVKQGDLVAEIDAVVLSAKVESTRALLLAQRAQLIDREAQVVLAEDKYQRQVQLKADDATSEEAYQSAKAAIDSAKAQLSVLKAQIQQTESTLKGDTATLGYSQIYAPLSGTVVSLTAKEGQTLNANQVAPIILRIADLSTMTVWTQVSEADVPKLREGMEAYFTTLGNPDRRWTGRLRQILPTPELANNVVLYTALFDVDNPDGELKTQMSAQVFFVVGSAGDVVTVPVSALHAYAPVAGTADKAAESRGPVQGPDDGTAAGATGAPSPPADRPRRPPDGAQAGGAFTGRGDPAMRPGQGRAPRVAGNGSGRPRVQAVTVVGEDGQLSERRVIIGVSNRVMAEVLEGLMPGETVVSGRKSAPAQQQAGAQGQRGPGGGAGPPGGFRFP